MAAYVLNYTLSTVSDLPELARGRSFWNSREHSRAENSVLLPEEWRADQPRDLVAEVSANRCRDNCPEDTSHDLVGETIWY